jgi:hypothetical protein
MTQIKCKLDAELYKHEIFRDIHKITSNCETYIVQMHKNVFQGLSSAVCAEVFNQIKHNVIREECNIICSAFGCIEQTVDSFTNQITEIRHFLASLFV